MKRIILLVLVLALLVAGIWFVRQQDQSDQRNMRDLYAAVEPLQRQKEALIAEREELEEEYDLLLRDPSTIEIMFRELDESLYTQVYPIMRDRGVTGILGVNLREYPGQFSRLTVDQVNRLLKDGWGCCLMYQEGYNIELWCSAMLSYFERDGLPAPTSIYFANDVYDPSWDEYLLSIGIDTIVLDAQDGHSSTVTRINQFWFTGAMPWNYTGVNSDIELLSYTDGANLVFTVSFENLWDAYEETSFVKMLDSLQEILVLENLLELEAIATPTPTPTDTVGYQTETFIEPMVKVISLEKARAAHLEAIEGRDALTREMEARRRELDGQIADLDEQIAAIYADWSSRK